MEVKIGVLHTPRELSVDTDMSVDDVEAAVEAAVSATKPSSLVVTDTKGRKVIVPASLVAYVEIAPADVRRVGFATG